MMRERTITPHGFSPEGREDIRNWKVAVILTGIIILALFLRVYFNVSEATDDGFKMTGGSDPYYMKRTIDWITTHHEHQIHDPMLNYPTGIPNPRPPGFVWTIAVTGMVISPFFDGDVEEATWWATLFIPALFGALTVIPVYLIGKESFNKRTGLLAAFLLAIMAGHINMSTFSMADHDSFYLFWAVVSIYYIQRALVCMKDGIWVKDWTRLRDIRTGFQTMVRENRVSLGYALFSGMSMSVIALSWKGFPYIMTIIVIYFFVQQFVNKLRGVDSLNISFITLVALAMPLALSAPYYALLGFVSWYTPPLFMLVAGAMVSLVMVPTRKVPWVLMLAVIGVLAAISLLLAIYVFEGFLLGGGQYFVRTKLFATIAEAQAPTFSRVAFSYGLVSFFLAFFIGIPYLFYRMVKSERKDVVLMFTWAAIAVYMTNSAVRFIFNGTPIIAIVSAWIIIEIIDWVDFRKMVKDIRGLLSRGDGIADRFKAFYRGTSPRHVMGAVLVLGLVVFPNFMQGLDAAIPYEDKKQWDDKIHDLYKANPLTHNSLYSFVPDDEAFTGDGFSTWYLGSFGPSFPNGYWLAYFDWLKEQNQMLAPEDRPAFLSWWDYGFWAIQLGEHPTVADNFQTGYQFAGNFIAAQGEEEAIALLIQRLLDTNIRTNNRKLGPVQESTLLKYLNQTQVDRLVYIHQNRFEFETKDVTAENAKIRGMKDILTGNLTLDELVDIYHELQVSTGHSIRYFAIDSRLFPFNAANNIFYAPVTLADLQVDTFLETLYYRGDEMGNRVGAPMTAKEVEELAARDPMLRIVDTTLDYKSPFFDTMLYKTFIGWNGGDVGENQGDGIPGVSGEYRDMNIMPGWMMRHFREVYRTFYFNPYPPDQVSKHPEAWTPMTYQEAIERGGTQGNISAGLNSGVTCLKYYDGAVVSGQVTTERGIPVEGIRMTMFDELLTPKDVAFTDSEGRYELIAPFGPVSIIASTGPMTSAEEYLLQVGNRILNSTTFNVTDQQAMRLVNWKITQNMEIASGIIEGRVYWDENNDGEYSSSADTLMNEPTIVLREMDRNIYYNLTHNLTPGSSGSRFGSYDPATGLYRFEGIPPGEYELALKLGGRIRTVTYFEGDNAVQPGEEDFTIIPTITRDIGISPASITGTVAYANGTLSERDMVLVDILDGSERMVRVNSGKYLIPQLLNGTYQLRVDGDDIFQAATPDISVVERDIRTVDVTLYPAVTVTGTTSYDWETRRNITVFFNSTIDGLSTQATSDGQGSFSVKLATTKYDITAAEYAGENYRASYQRVGLSHGEEVHLNMQNTMELTGIVYWDRNANNRYDDEAINREEVAGAEVILRSDELYLTATTTGAGHFTFRVPKGRYSLEGIDHSMRRAAQREVIFTAPEHVFIQLGSAHAVSGKVVTSGWTGSQGSNLIPGASLEFTSDRGTFSTVTGNAGNYSVYLPAGEYSVRASSFGHGDLVKTFDVQGNITVDFILDPEPILVTGRVTHLGSPMEGVTVAFSGGNETLTDADGRYSILLPPKNYLVDFILSQEDHRYYRTTSTTLNIGAGQITLNADVVRQLKVAGTILYHGRESTGDILFESDQYAVSENFEDGAYTAFVLPGRYQVSVNMEGNTYVRLMNIEHPLTLSMDASNFVRVRGYVFNDVDKDGRYTGPDSGVASTISFLTPDGHVNHSTSSSGFYSRYLFKGRYTVHIKAHGYEEFEREYDFTREDQYNFLMTPHHTRLHGMVWFDRNGNGVMERSEAVPFVPILIEDRDGAIKYPTVSNGTGRFSVSLIPGTYRIKAMYTATDGANYSRTIDSLRIVEGDGAVEQNLNLLVKFEISGTVRDYLRNEPVPDVAIDFLDTFGNTIASDRTDTNGAYRVVIAKGSYTIHAGTTLGGRNLVHLDTFTVERSRTLDLNLFKGVRFSGTLYSGNISNTVDIGRIDLTGSRNITLNTHSGAKGEYEFLIPAGRYGMKGKYLNRELTPDTEFVLDKQVDVTSMYNHESFNIEVEARTQYGFSWSVDETIKTAYIGYTANGYVGPEFIFTVTNTGNATQSVSMTYTFDNMTYWRNANVEPDTVSLKPGESGEVIFRVQPTENAPSGSRAEVTINATILDERAISREMTVSLVASAAKVGDAKIDHIRRSPSWDLQEGDEFTLTAEIVNPVEFSKNIGLSAIFERQTPSGQWEVISREEITVAFRGEKMVNQRITENRSGTYTYRIRLAPSASSEELDPNNNIATIEVMVHPKPEEKLEGWQGLINPINEKAWVSNLIMFAIVCGVGGTVGVVFAHKRGKRGRRYRRRHQH